MSGVAVDSPQGSSRGQQPTHHLLSRQDPLPSIPGQTASRQSQLRYHRAEKTSSNGSRNVQTARH